MKNCSSGQFAACKGCIVPVSVVKVEGGGATNRVRMEISILWLPTDKSICYLSVGLYVWKNDSATSEKYYPSRVLQDKLSLEFSSHCILG